MSEQIAEIGVLYAPFLGGMMVGCFLFGITISQTIIYFRNYKDDTLFLRALVGGALIVDTFHFVMVAEGVHNWYLFCKLPQNYAGLALFHWSLGASIIATYVITSMVQALYIMRVYMLSKNIWISIFIGTLSVAQLAFGLFLWEDLFVANSLTALHQTKGQIGGSVELAATTLCDIAISVALWWYLHKGRTGFASTEKMIDKLILYMVNLGLLTSVASLLTLILWLVMPSSFAFVSLTLIRSKLYCNAMLVTLNYRQTVRKAVQGNTSQQQQTSRYLQDLDGVEMDSKAAYRSRN
ncbi:hypothetical protein MVEN_01000500 [Mycena venus]|uniref:DUF6534 domain-containing protein n=1 Tax=Mycena venus TaxID=2733690 RepID=A0A8H6YEP5_9AGAR|nr:hypothetical protein MVEN_01000500 [Mycena venus]